MMTFPALNAGAELDTLIDRAAESHEPIQITGKHGNAVLVAEEDWSAIQETLHLLAVPGMRESIKEGLATPVEDCAKSLSW